MLTPFAQLAIKSFGKPRLLRIQGMWYCFDRGLLVAGFDIDMSRAWTDWVRNALR